MHALDRKLKLVVAPGSAARALLLVLVVKALLREIAARLRGEERSAVSDGCAWRRRLQMRLVRRARTRTTFGGRAKRPLLGPPASK